MVQKNCLADKVLVICGPTGSGKSALAIALAERFNGEIISADSVAIYKGLNIGTAKPSVDEQNLIKHHMIDVCEPEMSFTVSDYKAQATTVINSILSRKKLPIICGGTGFYINSLLYNYSYGGCEADESIRKKYETLLSEKGAEYVFNLLQKCDGMTAEKLHKNDTVRVIRALEIFEATGQKKSEIHDELIPNYNFKAFSYEFDRAELYSRINARVDKMFSLGLQSEVETLKKRGLTLENQSMQGIGYKEFFQPFESEKALIEAIKQNSRRYAKRQITFFKKLDNLTYLPNTSLDKTIDTITEMFINETK